ncbi:MAG: hypothetical protein JG782_518 [Anaerophaga sp.]|uniref:DUF6320 domain-containing protein n=1 Tax=Anaerophaga thermohalophila TaxID=177400 RepID=UPI000237C66F|nr:DUF6320 domain-containing protein [Anaerophaga thermohalophila]MBZ4675899.1 hypothetical protein [Anaerophaga sp.]MDI3520108.1 hypothetical protein [Anaerophaga sp.]MDN5291995.1 hypothetical protein [Anaerophaga sp.]
MIKCPYCGVELDENANFCSLCGEPLPKMSKDNPARLENRKNSRKEKPMTDFQKLSASQKRKIFHKISGIILLSGILITLVIDFVTNNTISWSKYPASVSLILFINITMATLWFKRYYLWTTLSFLSVSGLLILLDIYSGDSGWGMKLGIPLLLAAYITVFVLFKLIHNTRQKGLNIIAYSILAAGVLSLCVDGIVSGYHNDSQLFGWSPIVMVAAAIIAILLLYIHYKLKKVTDLKRFFHI